MSIKCSLRTLAVVVLVSASAQVITPPASATIRPTMPLCGDVLTTSVKLAGPMHCASGGLGVGANNITIDLNGFGITTESGIGIYVGQYTGVTIMNGVLRIGPDGVGVMIANVTPIGSARISKVTLIGSRSTETGYSLGIWCDGSLASVTVRDTTVSDFAAGLTSTQCETTVTASNFTSNQYGTLINAYRPVSLNGVTANHNEFGITAFGQNVTISNSTADFNLRRGIRVGGALVRISSSRARYNGEEGVVTSGAVGAGSAMNRVVAAYNGGDGFYFNDPGSLVFKSNTALGNGGSGVRMVVGANSAGFVGSNNVANGNLNYGFEADAAVRGVGNSASANTQGNCVNWTCR